MKTKRITGIVKDSDEVVDSLKIKTGKDFVLVREFPIGQFGYAYYRSLDGEDKATIFMRCESKPPKVKGIREERVP